MVREQQSGGGKSHGAVITVRAGTRIRAVAFKIAGKIYEGKPGESHGLLYRKLLRGRVVPSVILDLWTANEEDHGFVTWAGVFINRAEALKRFGITRSQDLTAQDAAGRGAKSLPD